MRKKSFVIGITGSTGSGKTTFALRLKKAIGEAVVLSSDRYYKDQSHLPLSLRLKENMDQPSAFDNELLERDIEKLAQGKSIHAPFYDFLTHTRKKKTEVLKSKPVVIVEGLLLFVPPKLRSLFDLRIFLVVDSDLRVCQRILRDVRENRNGSVEKAIEQYLFSARPMDKVFVQPQKRYADLIIDWNNKDERKIESLARLILGRR